MMSSRIAAALALALLTAAAHAQRLPPPTDHPPSGSVLRIFETPYYTLHTDLPDDDVREADLRITRMFEEYQQRTAGFAGRVQAKFPFYLYRNEGDYLAAGGPRGSEGVFIESANGNRLMAVVGNHTTARTWHVVQHEGFHQFIAATIKGQIPIWANEGLAEYFGESLWTGDGFVTGLIPGDRLADIRDHIRKNTFKSFAQLLTMTQEQWGDKLEYSNYDEAWAMIHFLAHGDNGKYQPAFVNFMTQVSHGADAQAAWVNIFGKDTRAFEARFAQWWMTLPDNPTLPLYMQALVQTETSYFARGYIMKTQQFPDLPTFFQKYQPPALGLGRDLWLPPRMFTELGSAAADVGDWTLEPVPNSTPRLVCKTADGSKYVGTFSVAGNKVTNVTVKITPPPSTTSAPATTRSSSTTRH